jgi:hypothetical protein
MHTTSTREVLNIPARHQLPRQASEVASYLKTTDIEMLCVVAFVAIGLLAILYSMLFGSFSQEISSALTNLSQGLLEAPRWDDMFLG